MIIVREEEPAKHMMGPSPAIAPTAEGAGFVKTGIFASIGILFLILDPPFDPDFDPDLQLGGSQPSSAFLFWQFLPRARYSQVTVLRA